MVDQQAEKTPFSRAMNICGYGGSVVLFSLLIARITCAPETSKTNESVIVYGDEKPTQYIYPEHADSTEFFARYQANEQRAVEAAQKGLQQLDPSNTPITIDSSDRKTAAFTLDTIIGNDQVTILGNFRSSYEEGIAEPFDIRFCVNLQALPAYVMVFEVRTYNYGSGAEREFYASIVPKEIGCINPSELIDEEPKDKRYAAYIFNGNSLANKRRTDKYVPKHMQDKSGIITVESCVKDYTATPAAEGDFDPITNLPLHRLCILDELYAGPLAALMKDTIAFETKHLTPTLQRIDAHDNTPTP